MTLDELKREIEFIRREDARQPSVLRPIVAIGHSKELVDYETVDGFLGFLRDQMIPVTTFSNVAARCP
jgi:hypothetical protein